MPSSVMRAMLRSDHDVRRDRDRQAGAVEDKDARRVDVQRHRLIRLSHAHAALHAHEGAERRLDMDEAFGTADLGHARPGREG